MKNLGVRFAFQMTQFSYLSFLCFSAQPETFLSFVVSAVHVTQEACAQQNDYRTRHNRQLSSVEQKQLCVQRWWFQQAQQGRVNTHGHRRLYPPVFPTPSTFTLSPKGVRRECQLWYPGSDSCVSLLPPPPTSLISIQLFPILLHIRNLFGFSQHFTDG